MPTFPIDPQALRNGHNHQARRRRKQPQVEKAVQSGTFRADLLGRLAGYMLRLPPLRTRMCDLGLIVAQLLARHTGPDAGHIRITSEACIALFQRRWPLNVRELDQALAAAIVLGRSKGEIDAIDLGEAPATLNLATHT